MVVKKAWTRLAALLVLAALTAPGAGRGDPPLETRDDILCRAESGEGYSYWWGGECWCYDGCLPDTTTCDPGECVRTGPSGCPDECYHLGTYGADCSGYVTKVWQVWDPSPLNACDDVHYLAEAFHSSGDHWDQIDRADLVRADVLASTGHATLFLERDPSGDFTIWESQGCDPGIGLFTRSLSSSFNAARRHNLLPDCVPSGEICDGADNDCNGVADDGAACLPGWALDLSGSSDVNGDGRADLCGRRDTGMICYLSSGSAFGEGIDGPAWSDGAGWNSPARYGTLRMGDMNGDGHDDLCGLSDAGFVCHYSDGGGFPASATADAFGGAEWGEAGHWATLRVADVNGDGRMDVCGLGASGFVCQPSLGEGFGAAVAGPAMDDAAVWGREDHFATIRMGDVSGDGRDDLCARGAGEMTCWLSEGGGFSAAVAGPAMTDADGWDMEHRWSTIRLADVNGDGLADICGRGSEGFDCCPSTGSGFGGAIAGPPLSDAAGWTDRSNYGTIRMGDVNGDGMADVCARDEEGVFCWLSEGDGFSAEIAGPALDDASGWHDIMYWSTLRLADIDGDGMDDLCARRTGGIRCWPSDGSGGFGAALEGPPLSDEAGWSSASWFATLLAATSAHRCVPGPETCDGLDNDCDGEVDEGCGADGEEQVPEGDAAVVPDTGPADADGGEGAGPSAMGGSCGCLMVM